MQATRVATRDWTAHSARSTEGNFIARLEYKKGFKQILRQKKIVWVGIRERFQKNLEKKSLVWNTGKIPTKKNLEKKNCLGWNTGKIPKKILRKK